jgi:hypothetical protein
MVGGFQEAGRLIPKRGRGHFSGTPRGLQRRRSDVQSMADDGNIYRDLVAGLGGQIEPESRSDGRHARMIFGVLLV